MHHVLHLSVLPRYLACGPNYLEAFSESLMAQPVPMTKVQLKSMTVEVLLNIWVPPTNLGISEPNQKPVFATDPDG